jgi:hypothetical protein
MSIRPLPLLRSRHRSLTLASPASVRLLLLGAGAAVVLLGPPAWSLAPVGLLLVWSTHEAADPTSDRRVAGHGSALLALAFVLAVSLPVVLSPALDQLALAGLVTAALAVVIAFSPGVRAALRLRRPRLGDLGWLVVALDLGVIAVMVAGPAVPPATAGELWAITALALLVPALLEVVLRGLLTPETDTPLRHLVLVALLQGCLGAALFGWAGLLAGVVLGIALGLVRLAGGWQASLFAHWGLALGVVAPVLAVAR